jgi:hypothetical protein
MKFLEYIKSTWNIVLDVAVILGTVIGGFTIPPHFNNRLIEDQVDFSNFSRFIIAAILLILLLPAHYFKRKKDSLKWWVTSVVAIIAAIILYLNYNSYTNEHSEWDDTSRERIVVGQTLLPGAKAAVDSFELRHPGVKLSKKDMVQGLGGAERVWPRTELVNITQNIVIRYLLTVILFASFVICVIQSIYIISKVS